MAERTYRLASLSRHVDGIVTVLGIIRAPDALLIAKLASALIAPLSTAILLLALGLLAPAFAGPRSDPRRAGRSLIVLGVAWLVLWSLPVASDALRGSIENRAGLRFVAELPKARAIVVLGGGMRAAWPPRRPDPDLGATSDRVWHAARLYHAGKAPRIILSGGDTRNGNGVEAEAMRVFLRDLGVPDAALTLERDSVNTETNAARVAELLRRDHIDTVLLVTSAMHMPRTRCLFERAGIKVAAAPTDFEVADMPFDLLRAVPDAEGLDGSGRAMKERVGWVWAGCSR